jgi:hypothetical protein
MDNIKKIAYNCQKATLLIEKKQLTRLTLREKFELKIHLAGCSVCKIFERQSIMINKQIKDLLHPAKQKDHLLDDTYKRSLQKQIEEKLK